MSPQRRTSATRLCAAVLVCYALLLLGQLGRVDGWLYDPEGRAQPRDFVGVYAAGVLVNAGRAAEAYDWTAHRAVQDTMIPPAQPGDGSRFLPWPYPPTLLPVAGVLATLPYGAAYLAWMATTLAAFALAAAAMVGRPAAAIWMAAGVTTLFNLQIGQNGLLSAALLGGGLALLGTRPVIAGCLLGLMTYKPHLALLVPLALLAGGYRRPLAAMAVTAGAMGLISFALYGGAPWAAFVDQLGRVAAATADAREIYKLQSVYGLFRTLGLMHEPALALHACVAAAAVPTVTTLWWRAGRHGLPPDGPHPLICAALVTGTLLISPYLFAYDQAVLMVPLAFLLRDALRRGPVEPTVHLMLAANLLLALVAIVDFPCGVGATLLVGLGIAGALRRALLPASAWQPHWQPQRGIGLILSRLRLSP